MVPKKELQFFNSSENCSTYSLLSEHRTISQGCSLLWFDKKLFAPENAIMVSQKMPDVLSYDKEAFFRFSNSKDLLFLTEYGFFSGNIVDLF